MKEKLLAGDWKYPYKVNTDGQLFRKHKSTWKEIKGHKRKGQHEVKICTHDGKYKALQLKRVIYEAFKGKIPDGYFVKSRSNDSKLSNLYLMTKGDAMKRNTRRVNSKPVVLLDDNDLIINSWPSATAAAKDLYVHPSAVRLICNNKSTNKLINVAWEKPTDLLLDEKKRGLKSEKAKKAANE